MIAKVSSIGDDLSKSKPALNEAVKTLFASAATAQIAALPVRAPPPSPADDQASGRRDGWSCRWAMRGLQPQAAE